MDYYKVMQYPLEKMYSRWQVIEALLEVSLIKRFLVMVLPS